MAREVEAKINVKVETSGVKKAFDSIKKGAASVTKGIGNIFSAIGKLGIITAIGGAIAGAFKGNQAVVDAFNKVITTVSLIFNQIASAIADVIGEQAALNGGFDATKKVLGGLISGVLNVFLGTLQTIKLGVLIAQRAWEDSFFGGGDQEKIKELNAEIKKTREELSETGSAIAESGKQVVNNFAEAVKEVADTTTAVVKAVVKESKNIDLEKATADAERLVQLRKAAALADAERQKIQLEFQRTAEQLRQLRDDENRSLADRQQSNADLLKTLEDQAAAEEKQIKIKIAAAQAEFNLQQTNENLVALKQAQLELTDLQERLEGQRSEALSNQNALLKEQVDIERANVDANLELLESQLNANVELADSERQKLELQLRNIDILKEARLQAIDEELAQTAEGTARFAELTNQRAQIEQDAANETAKVQRDLDQKTLESRQQLNQAIFAVTSQGLNAIADLATQFAGDDEKRQKKAFQLSKALQIADATMATYTAVVGALQAKGPDGLLPFPLRVANAAVAGAVGLANVLKIKNTKFSASAAPDKPQTSGGSAQPIDPTQALQGGTSLNNVVTRQGAGGQGQPIRAYVVADEVTSAQQANKRIQDQARL